MRTLLWFRGKDLRLADHAPLTSALADDEVVCVFVLDPYFFAPERAARIAHRMQFLLESLRALAEAIAARGSRLFLVEGKSTEVVPDLARRWSVDRVIAQRWTEPFARERDARIAAALDVPFELTDGETLAAPGTIVNGEGRAYSVFSAFARAFRKTIAIASPLRAPRAIPPPPRGLGIRSAPIPTLEALGIPHNPRLPRGGEEAAHARLAKFLRTNASRYDRVRDRVDLDATSRLSVDLKFGTLSARTAHTRAARAIGGAAWRRFEDELLWREFTHYVLWEHPSLLAAPHRAAFASFPWARDERGWRAWATGTTGYPIVDASARQLLAEGFVPNRARMISASFLTKDLRIDFRRGEAHYLAHLVDGDWAQNDFGWQWTTGCGFDAAPYFRVFNPVEQGKRFDPTGAYVRRWIPELARLPDRVLHEPWRAPPPVLAEAGVELGRSYPRPIVDHREARMRYLATVERCLTPQQSGRTVEA